ncbi:acetoacetate--CoA ligase [Actinomycetospora endophytica]|uniref:acetoacetate--CoA ligase n=1 Tax=Actinomycetospora endophytica TaxID=2291215 RepID=UPI0035581C43
MRAVTDERGEILRPVPPDAATASQMGRFLTAGLGQGDYRALHRWSVDDPEAFWRAVVAFFDIEVSGLTTVLADAGMPGARWLPGARLSYSAHALRPEWTGPAVVGISQTRERVELSYDELRDQVARARAGLVRLGVGPGDRVAGYLPHVPETIVAFLATASLGAVWLSCPPEFGPRAVVDRLGQVEPAVLIAVDGTRYGDRPIDRTAQLAEIRAALPSLRATVLLPYLDPSAVAPDGALSWADLLAEPGPLEHAAVAFDHPLYVLFSSGTTGLPKPIVHGHGGIVLEHHKTLGLHNDVRPGDRFFWYSTTGWIMWNYGVSALLVGATVVCVDGNPAWPDVDALWAMAERERLTQFGTSASFLMMCRDAGLRPGHDHDLSALRMLGSTGSPLPPEGFRWAAETFGPSVLVNSTSGGTDVASGFVGAAPLLPVRAGEIPGPMLGVDVHAFDDDGRDLIGEPGELVITAPMPSMPVALWGDDDGARMRATWFDRFPGVWTQGDWITVYDDGGCVISGRSDATLNRGGVRLGTSDFYSVVEDVDGISDSLVVHLEDSVGGAGTLVLFLVGGPDREGLEAEIVRRLRSEMSPRHVPDEVAWVAALPRTLSGKKLETPVKRLLVGAAPESVASRDSLADPAALDEIVEWVRLRRS